MVFQWWQRWKQVMSVNLFVVNSGDTWVDLHSYCAKDNRGQSLDSQTWPGTKLKDQGRSVQQQCLVRAHSHKDEEKRAQSWSTLASGHNHCVSPSIEPHQGSQGQVVNKGHIWVKWLLDVLPIELNASGSNLKKEKNRSSISNRIGLHSIILFCRLHNYYYLWYGTKMPN